MIFVFHAACATRCNDDFSDNLTNGLREVSLGDSLHRDFDLFSLSVEMAHDGPRFFTFATVG